VVFRDVEYFGQRRPDPLDVDDQAGWAARANLSYELGLAAAMLLAESLVCRMDGVLPTFAPCAVMHRASAEAKFEVAFFPEGMAALQRWREKARRRDAVLIRDGKATIHIGILDEDLERAWALHCVLDVVLADGKLATSTLGVNNDYAGHIDAYAFVETLDEMLAEHPRVAELVAGYGVLGVPKM
jgi:hypothetical protein